MTITTAEYKAAIEAKIAAASGATSLKDLTLIKTNADLWLLNNDGGTITGYASLEALIQDYQDDLTGGSTSIDLSFVGVSAFPPLAASSGTSYQNNELITTSGTWTVPANVFKLKVFATGGGGGGGGSITGDGPTPGSGGAAGGTAISEISVEPGQVLTIVIGAGGVGVNGASGTDGGKTTVQVGNYICAIGLGGGKGVKNSSSATNPAGSHSIGAESIVGGGGGQGGTISGGGLPIAGGGFIAFVRASFSSGASNIPGLQVNNGGTGGTVTGGGGGGGGSFYGDGGDGGDGVSANIVGVFGSAPISTHYGAGGGGAGGSNGSGGATGGDGISGAVEIYY